MCGRYTMGAKAEALAREFLVELTESLEKHLEKPRYNIAPSQPVLAVLEDSTTRERKTEIFHWGLVPGWAKDVSIAYKLTNARSESVMEKPSFRDAIRYRRCLIPCTGFYEWKRDGRARQPWYFSGQKEETLAMAGIWEYWQSPDGSEILSTSILTQEANEVMKPIHHRIPVFLESKEWSSWLDTKTVMPKEIQPMIRPVSENLLQKHPVDSRVNHAATEGPELIKPIISPNSGEQLGLFE